MTATPATDIERRQQAKEIYRRRIDPKVEAENLDRLVAIDLESEDFEIGDDLFEIGRRLKDRHPNARLYGFRVGGGGGPVDRFHSFRNGSSR